MALLHDCDIRECAAGAEREGFLRETATYGSDVQQREVEVERAITSVRLLRDIPKLGAG